MGMNIYEIIAASIAQEELTREEELRLREWISASLENRFFYEELLQIGLAGEILYDPKNFSRMKIYNGIWRRIYRLKTIKYRVWYVASVVAVIVCVCGGYLIRERNVAAEVTGSEIKGVELRLADGRILDLSSEVNNVNIVANRLSIPCDSNSLDYSRADTSLIPQTIGYNTLIVPMGAEYTVILCDGTKVRLNSASEFRYPAKFADERVVSLKGEAYFEVAKDSLHPFFVNTTGMVVEVVGTSFNLSAYQDEGTVAATLVSGRIHAFCNGTKYIVNPGEQVVCDKNSGEVSKREVNTDSYVSWKDGLYSFEAIRLEDILQALSRWYGFHTFYVNPQLKDIEFSGRLRRYEKLGELLDKFEKTHDVCFELKNETLTVSKK